MGIVQLMEREPINHNKEERDDLLMGRGFQRRLAHGVLQRGEHSECHGRLRGVT